MIAAVQQSLALEKVAWDTAKNMVVIRDRISKVTAARKLFDQLLQPRAQVELEVEFIEWNRSDMLNYGLSLPTSFPLVNLTTFLHNQYTVPSGISGLALFGGGASLFGLGMADVQLIANMTQIARADAAAFGGARRGRPARVDAHRRSISRSHLRLLRSAERHQRDRRNRRDGRIRLGRRRRELYGGGQHPRPARTGTMTIADQIFTVTQEAQGGGRRRLRVRTR